MKIGIFTECYHPVLNGVVVSIDTFKKELEKRGHQYYIFTTDSLEKVSETNVFRYPIMLPFKPKGGRYPIAWPQNSRRIARKIKDLELDLIHCQHVLGLGSSGQKVAKILRIPAVLTYHTLLEEYAHYVPLIPGVAKSYLIRQSRNKCNTYDQIITPSPSMAKILVEYGVTKPIESIATGVNLEDFEKPFTRQELYEKWQIPPQKKLLLYVSRIAKEKNVDLLISAVKALAEKRSDFHLLMIGGGPELTAYKKMAQDQNLTNLITFTGMQPKDQTEKYFGAADIFTFPSYTETQGIVVTEAMAAGIPAVAINQMGPTDIIKNGIDGFLTSLKVEDFSGKIESLLSNDQEREKMGEAAQKNALEFSNVAMADKLEKLYVQVKSNYHS